MSRKYDGKTADGTKTLSTNEFLGRLRSMKDGMNISDKVVLNLLGMFMAGPAWEWWQTMQYSIHTLDEFEEQMWTRFDKQRMDTWSQRLAFASRKQGTDEYISDYIDEMCRRAHNIRPRMEELEIVQIIIDNANLKCQAHLLNKAYASIAALRRHANFLGTRLLNIPKIEQKTVPKRYVYRPTSVQAIEAENEWIEVEAVEENDSGSESNEIVNINAVTHGTKPMRILRTKRDPTRTRVEGKSGVKTPTVEQSQGIIDTTNISNQITGELMEIRCFGCNAPGILKRNCQKCNSGVANSGYDFVCFGCGAPNVMRRDCPKCQTTDSKNEVTRL